MFRLLLLMCFTGHSLAGFNSRIVPTCSPDDAVCEVTLTIERYETNALIDFVERTSTRVRFANGTFYYGDRSFDSASDSLCPLSEEDAEDVWTGDGTYKMSYFINQQLPGPTIAVYSGQAVRVRVENQLLTEGISIHWHGVPQTHTYLYDGVAGLTQCPINPQESFTYQFVATPVGTSWYHSEVGAQRQDGLYGAFIVLPRPIDPQELTDPSIPTDLIGLLQYNMMHGIAPLPPSISSGIANYRVAERQAVIEEDLPEIDDSFVVLLADSYQQDSTDWLEEYLASNQMVYDGHDNFAPCSVKGAPIKLTSGVVNGMGRSDDANYPSPWARFTIESAKNYVMRVINAFSNFGVRFSIDQHKLSMLATDGRGVVKTVVDYAYLAPGETYDIRVLGDQEVSNYWIRGETIEQFPDEGLQDQMQSGEFYAVLQYEGAPPGDPHTTDDRTCDADSHCLAMNCYQQSLDQPFIDCVNVGDIESLVPAELTPTPDNLEEYFLNFQLPSSSQNTKRASVNYHNFVLPTSPPLWDDFQANGNACDEAECSEELCRCTYVIDINLNSTVQLNIANSMTGGMKYSGGNPISVHLHGYHFNVLRIGYPTQLPLDGVEWMPDLLCVTGGNCERLGWSDASWYGGNVPGLNLHDPVSKHTVLIPKHAYAVLRFDAINPGYWLLSSEYMYQKGDGMAVVLRVGEPDDMPAVPSGFPRCGSWSPSYPDIHP